MPRYSEILKKAEKYARLHHLEASAVKLLMLHFSNLSPTELYTSMNETMPDAAIQSFEDAVSQYVDHHVPVQYIIGYVYFYGYKFLVDERVLIPRFETEELVANTLMMYDEVFNGKPISCVDVGTGSGCLAIALKKEEPSITMTATDMSESALAVARDNAVLNDASITFLQGDMLKPLAGKKFDLLISNPPYIPETEIVPDIIKANEPSMALYGGSDGMKFYQIILDGAESILNSTFIIAFEHAYDKASELQSMAKRAFPNATVQTFKDMQAKDRMTFIIQR